MEHVNFCHLHTHTEYSLLDGACKIESLVRKAKEFKMPALAITDHGNLFGAIEFYQSALQNGIKPIIGVEVYMAPGSRFEKKGFVTPGETAYHLTLLAKDQTGYKNLIKLINISYQEGFYYKPRIDKESLSMYSRGLICLSGCLKAEVPSLLIKDRVEEARKVIEDLRDIFGKDFYLELQDNGLKEQRVVISHLLDIGKKLCIPFVATNDVHYIKKEDSYSHEILLCIQTVTNINDPNRLKFSTPEFYFKNIDEMSSLFAECPEAITNTIRIAEACNLTFDFSRTYLPPYTIPEGYKDANEYLEDLCREGLKSRYKKITPEIESRLREELDIIKKTGYAGYFLIVWDFVKYAKENGILVGPGRGSAVGSLVVYSLGITNIDPLSYGLIFERFLNPERVSPPDIDIDFCEDRRDEVIKYIIQKYGAEKVSQIITFGTLKPRQVIRDVGRAFDIPYSEVDKLAKLISNDASSIEEALDMSEELKELIKKDQKYGQVIKVSSDLQGLVRHASTHAAGVVIAPEGLENYTPFYKDTKGEIATQYDMDSLGRLGLIKIDILGLRNLTIIKDTVSLVKENRGIEIDINNIPMDDPATYQLLCEANTIGVFQIESGGFRELLKKIKPERFEDLIAILSLHRPGPLKSGMVDDFIKRRKGEVSFEYLHPKLTDILKETYGIIVYQEQVMKIANILANFSLGLADLLRRAMGKKIPEEMEKLREAFIQGAMKNGLTERKATEIFNLMEHFAGYGFNKSHSAAYATISYQTAYLKANYPLEYMTSLLSNEMGDTDKLVEYITECKRMGIGILPPDIQKSVYRFMIENQQIRFGLGAVKNVGEGAVSSIVKARTEAGEFKSLEDFCSRVDMRLVNRKVLESLIKCGAFDSLGISRAALMDRIDNAMEIGARMQKDIERGQFSLFENQIDSGFREPEVHSGEREEWGKARMLAFEKEVLGFYLSGHPLANFEAQIEKYATTSTGSLKNIPSEGMNSFKRNREVKIAGVIIAIKKLNDRNGKKMAFVTLEDLEGTVEIVIFSEIYEKYSGYIRKDFPVLVIGDADLTHDTPKVIAKEFIPLQEVQEKLTKAVHITLNTLKLSDQSMLALKEIVLKYKGDCPLFIHLRKKSDQVTLIPERDFYINPSPEFVNQIDHLFGGNVVMLE